MFFKIIHKRPSKQKRQARPQAAGGNLRSDMMCIAVAECTEAEDGRLRYDISGKGGVLPTDNVALLSYLHADSMWLRDRLHGHQDTHALECRLEGYTVQGCHLEFWQITMDGLLASMAAMADGGTRASHGGYSTENPIQQELLQKLHNHGFVKFKDEPGDPTGAEGCWQLTKHGLRSLRYECYIGDGVRLLDPRTSRPIADQTVWELVVSLLDRGWLWNPLPKERRETKTTQKHTQIFPL